MEKVIKFDAYLAKNITFNNRTKYHKKTEILVV